MLSLNCHNDPCKLTLDTVIGHWVWPTISSYILQKVVQGLFVFKHWHMQTNTRTDFKLKILSAAPPWSSTAPLLLWLWTPKHETWIWTSHHNYLYSGSLSASTSKQHCHILCPRWHQSPRGAVTHPHHQHGKCWILASHFSNLTFDVISVDLNWFPCSK